MFDEDIDTWTYITGMLQTQVWDIPIAWLRTTKAGMYVLKMDDSKVYAIIDGVLTVYDIASNAISYLTGDDAVVDPVPLLPTSWIETIPSEKLPGGSGSSSSSSSSNSSVDFSEIISTLTEGVGGVFSITGSAFDFIFNHSLTMIMVCVSFAGAGLGFVARAFSTSRK